MEPDWPSFLNKYAGWGHGEAKTIGDLTDEINAGESHLVIDSSGIHRVLSIVRMNIVNKNLGTLVHVKTVLPDGRVRKIQGLPSGKIIRGETPLAALQREMTEELNLDPQWYTQTPQAVIMGEDPSKSYPRLPSIYEIHPWNITIHEGIVELRQGGFVTQEDEQVLYFSWQKDFVPTPSA